MLLYKKYLRNFLVFVFLLVPSLGFSGFEATLDEEDDPTTFQHVNVISGHLNLAFHDAEVEGAVNIPIQRTYSSAGALERIVRLLDTYLRSIRGGWMTQGGWNLFPHTNLLIELDSNPKYLKAHLSEPSGQMMSYSYKGKGAKHWFRYKPENAIHQTSGKISRRTNPSYNSLEINYEKDTAILFLSNGGKRIYKGKKLEKCLKNSDEKTFYLLDLEVLPSGQKVRYIYNKERHLVRIESTNPSESKVYAFINIEYIRRGKAGPFQLKLNTSDGKEFFYDTTSYENREYICSVKSNCRPQEGYHFPPGRKGVGARLVAMELGRKRGLFVEYYMPPNKKLEKKWSIDHAKRDFCIDKVKTISAPVGPDGEMIPVAHFTYHEGRTDVRDSEGLLIQYYYDGDKINKIEYFDEKENLYSSQRFYWNKANLICKAMFDANNNPLFAKTFTYHEGNVVQEVLWGSLTGKEIEPLKIDSSGSCSGSETYSKTFSYYDGPFNLLRTEKEEEGLTYEYFYKPGSDLCTKKLTKNPQGQVLIREMSFYDEDNLCVHQIIDDGFADEPNDLTNISQRIEKVYIRTPSTGMVETLCESCIDPISHTKQHLRTVRYTYVQNKVHTEEVFDANKVFRYKIETDYDKFGFVKRKTTGLGQESTYLYNEEGCLEESKEVGLSRKRYIYDKANRLIACEELDTGKVARTAYDTKGRIVMQTDARGNELYHTYDPFGNRTITKLPFAKDQQDGVCQPTLHFSYDIHGNLIAAEMPLGEKTTNTFNLYRKPVLVTEADGNYRLQIYNTSGSLKEVTYCDGVKTYYEYDLFKRETSKKTYSADGALLASESWVYTPFQLKEYEDIRGLKTEFTYDGSGRKIKERAADRESTFSYDALGFLERIERGETAFVQKHTILGLVEEQWEESFGEVENRMAFVYDEENRKIEAVRETSKGFATDFLGYTHGKLTSHIDPNGEISTFSWNEFFENALGQKVLQKTIQDPLGILTIETYDAGERLVSREKKDKDETIFKECFFYDASGNQAKRVSYVYIDNKLQKEIFVTWKHDQLGRVVEETEGGKKTTYYAYDKRGRLKKKILPDGVFLEYFYNGVDLLEELLSSDGLIHYRYFYGKGPDPLTITDVVEGSVTSFVYNLFGEVTEETNSRGLKSLWEYDSLGRCSLFTLPDGSFIAYPTKGKHISAVQRLDPFGNLLYQHTYSKFDQNGHVEQEELICHLGTVVTSHDLLERPSDQTSSYLYQSIAYGPSGLVKKVTSSLLGDKDFQHDPLSQLKQEGKESYHFDSLGNPSEYVTNDLNQVEAGADYLLTYDGNGNLKTKVSTEGISEYTFDPLGRLRTITIGQRKKICYSYDPLSRLSTKEVYELQESSSEKIGTLFYLYDREHEIGTLDENGTLLELKVLGLGIRGDIGAAVAIELQGNIYAPLHDFSGNIIAIVSKEGFIAEKYDTNAFGKEERSSFLNPWRFSSKRSEEGLFFFGLRFYDPTLKRWLSPDPAGFVDGANLYVFVHNSPLNRLDLFGLLAEDPFGRMEIRVPVFHIPEIPLFKTLEVKGSIGGTPIDFVVCCGYLHKLAYVAKESKTDTIDLMEHLDKLMPDNGSCIGLISIGNGIKTSLPECLEMSKAVSSKAAGTLVLSLYNRSEGVWEDVKRTGHERKGVETPIVCLNRQFMETIAHKLQNINPELLWLSIPHSEGGVIARRTIEGMTDESKKILKKILHVFAVAPALPLSNSLGASVVNVYSEKDYITGFGPFGYAKEYLHQKDYNIRILQCISPMREMNFFCIDHRFLAPTYQESWGGHIKKMNNDFQFYTGKNVYAR